MLTFDEFKKRLKKGVYKSKAGANRAVGKAGGMKPGEKTAAKAAVARKFK